MMYNLAALICGLLFGAGLTISQMINAIKVQNFLDITGNWDPSLALVMLSAVVVTWLGYRFVLHQQPHPKLAEKFSLPMKKSLDSKLIIGSAVFGIGWGLAGYCPGPAIAALGLGILDAFYFVLGMVVSLIGYPIITQLYKKLF